MQFLAVSGISRQEKTHFALKDISFTQEKSRKIAIAGETGSGKSTLLKIIAGLVQQDAGQVRFEGEKVWGPNYKLVPGHPGISYLSQYFELRNNYRVEDLLAIDNQLSDEASAELYRICRIDHFLKRKTDQLSGGEKHRIALARALSFSPRLLLLDEPYYNLDVMHKDTLKSVIRDIGEKLEITCILISHDPEDTLSWADEILVMQEGEIIQRGSPQQIYGQPASEYVAGLFGKYNLIRAEQVSLLSGLPGITANGKNVLIRPGHFKIIQNEEQGARAQSQPAHGLPAKVDKVTFLGDVFELDVSIETATSLKTAGQIPAIKVIVKTTGASHLAAGDNVRLSLGTGAVCYI
jgi:ABC-type glutathione transport system ATPase component